MKEHTTNTLEANQDSNSNQTRLSLILTDDSQMHHANETSENLKAIQNAIMAKLEFDLLMKHE